MANTREGIIDRFSSVQGFNLLILSPEVAGVGLTITAANHVIHYGRWWNPAKENQATDRAYRIGQTKPVFVHHLILRDKTGAMETFDEKLHRLLKAREDLADNFLAPAGDETAIQADLLGKIFGPESSDSSSKQGLEVADVSRMTPYEFECMVALALKSRFESIYVTPRSGDRGVDVLGISKTEVVLIQCKKMGSDGVCSVDVLEELTDGADFYRELVIPQAIKRLPLKSMLVTTGKFDRSIVVAAKAKGIDLVDGAAFRKIIDGSSVSWADINALDSSRVLNIKALAEELSSKLY